MQAKLYVNNSDDKALTKSITLVDTVSVKLKEDTEMVNPVIILAPSTPQNFNYVYLADFDRYYFVSARTYSQQRYIVELHCDVLMSFVDEIKNLVVIADRSSARYNLFLQDNDLPIMANSNVCTIPFYNGFNSEGNEEFILAVAGGYQPITPTQGGE